MPYDYSYFIPEHKHIKQENYVQERQCAFISTQYEGTTIVQIINETTKTWEAAKVYEDSKWRK